MSAPYTELERPLDNSALLCRGCLAESGEMKDMVEWGLTDDFYRFTELQVVTLEGLSQLLCTTCEDVLLKCKAFHNQCWSSDAQLRDIAKKNQEIPPPSQEESSIGQETGFESAELQLPQETVLSCVIYDHQLVIMVTPADMESKIYLSCPYNECSQKFLKKKDLLAHLMRRHSASEKFTIDLQYYCNHTNCSYHINSPVNKWFSGRKYLNQHINKVHKCKCFHCDICHMEFSTSSAFHRHIKSCNMSFPCKVCDKLFKNKEQLLVHLLRRHPDLHKQYKDERKASKRKANNEIENKKVKVDDKLDCICDSPKRSFATQTLKPEENIKNDVTLSPWYTNTTKADYKTDEISTQTVFEDLLSLKSQNSEDESLFFSETVSLSDIQTQTFPIEFGLSRSNKETITSETQSPDLSIKETQTCFCLYDSPKVSYKLFDSISSSPASINLTSTQTQTALSQPKSTVTSDMLLSFSTTETQTYFEDETSKDEDDI